MRGPTAVQANSALREDHAPGVHMREFSTACFNPMRDVVWPVPTENGKGIEIYIQRHASLYEEVLAANGYVNRCEVKSHRTDIRNTCNTSS
jgi:hypothetical protein